MSTPQQHNSSNSGPENKKTEPYGAPDGYFEDFSVALNKRIEMEELREIAPFLSSLQNTEPFSAPSGYFDELPVLLAVHRERKNGKEKNLFSRFSTPRFAISVLSTAAMLLLIFTLFSPSVQKRQILLSEVSQEELEDYVSNELSLEMDAEEIGELLAVENNNAVSGAPVETLSEYIVEEVSLTDIIEEF